MARRVQRLMFAMTEIDHLAVGEEQTSEAREYQPFCAPLRVSLKSHADRAFLEKRNFETAQVGTAYKQGIAKE